MFSGDSVTGSREPLLTHRTPDERRCQDNIDAGHTLCDHCSGTGNELYSMFRCCPVCGGSGIKTWHGERSALVRRWLEWRASRRLRVKRPFNPNAEIRVRLSRWFGIGEWFADPTDACHRCGVWPSDNDFAMRRVRPFKAECLERDLCDEMANETRGEASLNHANDATLLARECVAAIKEATNE